MSTDVAAAGPAAGLGDWEPAEFEENGRELLAYLRGHFAGIRDVPVADPCDTAELVASLDAALPEDGVDFQTILRDTREKVVPHLVQWNHPAFFGYFPTCASLPGVLAETLTAALNVNAMLWKTSPAASALEAVVLRWLARMAGYPEDADGVLVNGASLANLYALAAARDSAAAGVDVRTDGLAAAGRFRVYTSDQAHSSVDKAVITLGIGLANLVRVPSDDRYRMRPDALEAAIARDLAAGYTPVAVVATVGTTSVAAADPLGPISEICARHGVWLHVDAAYAGFYRVSAKAPELEDPSVGDSLVVNPQKTLFVPLEGTALYCRRRDALANTFRLVPEYLTSAPDDLTFDFMDRSAQLGRSFRALKMWWVIRTYGRAGLAARLDHAIALAEDLRRTARAHPDWAVPVDSPYPLVSLRYAPREVTQDPDLTDEARRDVLDTLNAAILGEVNAGGDAYLSHSVIRDGYVMRVSIGNIRTGADDVRRLWDLLTATADKRLAEVRR